MAESMYPLGVRIKVFGIGGAGCNAVTRMVNEGAQGAEFYVVNTDVQALNTSPVKNKIILGRSVTKGQGAGGKPEIGRKAAMESEEEIRKAVSGADMVFVAAGMGGGTGTGAAPLFASISKESGALTVGIVTKPFSYEGKTRLKNALDGLEELRSYVDSLIIISNDRLMEIIGRIPLMEAFREADNVLRQGVQTITDLVNVPGMINIDFADIKSVMSGQGSALIGIGMAKGENKAVEAAQKAISSPLLEAQIEGATHAIFNITGGEGMSIQDSQDAVNFITNAAGEDIDFIYGVATNEKLGDTIIVTVIATGFDLPKQAYIPAGRPQIAPRPAQGQQIEDVMDFEETSDIPRFFKNRDL